MAVSRSVAVGLALGCAAACGRHGFDAADGPPGTPDGADEPDAGDPFAYADLADGWSIAVFRDFPAEFAYDAMDFVDGPETYDNLPRAMFVTRAPYPEALVVAAGRVLYEFTEGGIDAHDLGQHPPNTVNLPDTITNGVWIDDLDGAGPNILVSSSSANGGDGLFTLSTGWLTQTDTSYNNVRGVAWDGDGAFDGVGAPTAYLATMNGVLRRTSPLGSTLITLDTIMMKVLPGGDALIVRRMELGDEQLIRVETTSHDELAILEGAELVIGDGAVPGAVASILVDTRDLYRLGATNDLLRIARVNDASRRWQWVATPPSVHALGTTAPRFYVVETDRDRDVDRILVIDGPP